MITMTLTAGALVRFEVPGDFFRLMSASLPLDVRFYKRGAEVAASEQVSGGYAEKFGESFDAVTLVSAATQTVQFVARLGNQVQYDTPPNGNVTVTNTGGAFTQASATVTNASGTLLAANAARRYLLIQNNDSSGDIFVTLNGVAATAALGAKIAAGGSLEIQGYAPTGAINAIGSIASNANVVVIEG